MKYNKKARMLTLQTMYTSIIISIMILIGSIYLLQNPDLFQKKEVQIHNQQTVDTTQYQIKLDGFLSQRTNTHTVAELLIIGLDDLEVRNLARQSFESIFTIQESVKIIVSQDGRQYSFQSSSPPSQYNTVKLQESIQMMGNAYKIEMEAYIEK